jgi:hypothetical protein
MDAKYSRAEEITRFLSPNVLFSAVNTRGGILTGIRVVVANQGHSRAAACFVAPPPLWREGSEFASNSVLEFTPVATPS